MMLTRSRLPVGVLLAVGCASVPQPPQPAVTVAEDLQRELDSAIQSLDTLTRPTYYAGPPSRKPVHLKEHSGVRSMFLRHPSLSRPYTTTTDKQPRCHNPLFRHQRGAV